MQTVHLRVNDAETGKPTPCRIRVLDEAGAYYAPFGRLTEFATTPNQDVGGNVRLGAQAFAYIDGTCEIALPPGKLRVDISKGPEYAVLREEVTLAPGKLALRFTLPRLTNLQAEGWYSGDTRVHFLSPHAALLEAQAEHVHLAHVLATETQHVDRGGRRYPAIANILAFSGQAPALAAGGHLVAVGTHNTHPELGSLALLHCHRVVYPLSFGGPHGKDDWTFDDWCDQCHRKKGLVVWSRTAHESQDGFVGEPLANLILGKVDTFEITYFEDSPFDVLGLWYALLDAGCGVPLAGASGKESNGSALGVMRTYAKLRAGEALGYGAWIEAVRAGRTFVTNGPLLRFAGKLSKPEQSIEEAAAATGMRATPEGRPTEIEPGATLTAEPHEVMRLTVEIQGWAEWDSLEVVYNGQVVGAASRSERNQAYSFVVPVGRGGWLAARCTGQGQVADKPAYQRTFAHTSPCYVRVGASAPPAASAAIDKLLVQIESMAQWARDKAHCDTDKDRQRLLSVFESARAVLAGRRSLGP